MTHTITVRFGNKNKQYWVDHHDRNKLRLDLSRIKEEDIANPFCGKYWDFQILNNVECETI